jgi:hypothetical protein
LTTTNKNTILSKSFPTIVNISNDETDHFLNKRDSSNILFNLEESDEDELPFPGFIEKAFYCLGQKSPLRSQCLKLITWPWFERLTMIVILINCLTLGIYEPCAHHTGVESSKRCDTTFCILLRATDYFIFCYFIIEMCIRMIAMGIFGKGSYLAESWNRLDCFIVVTGYDHNL